MCFSQKASFGAAAVLVGVGAIALSRSRTPAQHAVAMMPFIFAAQQCTEGAVWMSLLHPEYSFIKRTAMYAFLFFAEMVWPVFIPLIVLQGEYRPDRRRLIRPFIGVGIGMVLLLIYGMIAYPVDVRLQEGHLLYDVQYPVTNMWQYGVLYFMPTVAAPLFSSHRTIRILGLALLLSYVASRVFYNHYIISIWCYFAALISMLSVFIIRELATELQAVPTKR